MQLLPNTLLANQDASEKVQVKIESQQSQDVTNSNQSQSKKVSKSKIKRTYNKIPDDVLDKLNQTFLTQKYPQKEEMQNIADQFGYSLMKIENWFKHQRRIYGEKGLMNYSKKKTFTNQEWKILDEFFEKWFKPSKTQYKIICQQLNCPLIHIRNWFAHQRKLVYRKLRTVPKSHNHDGQSKNSSEDNQKFQTLNKKIQKSSKNAPKHHNFLQISQINKKKLIEQEPQQQHQENPNHEASELSHEIESFQENILNLKNNYQQFAVSQNLLQNNPLLSQNFFFSPQQQQAQLFQNILQQQQSQQLQNLIMYNNYMNFNQYQPFFNLQNELQNPNNNLLIAMLNAQQQQNLVNQFNNNFQLKNQYLIGSSSKNINNNPLLFQYQQQLLQQFQKNLKENKNNSHSGTTTTIQTPQSSENIIVNNDNQMQQENIDGSNTQENLSVENFNKQNEKQVENNNTNLVSLSQSQQDNFQKAEEMLFNQVLKVEQ